MSAPGNLDLIHDPARAAALLDPLRMRLLERMERPTSAAGLARGLGLPRQKVNYHLRELERAGFVEFVEERKRGNCVERLFRAAARYYVIDPAVLGALGGKPEEMQDRLSSTYLVAVAAQAIRDVASLRQRAAKAGKRLATMTLEAEVRFASAAERAAFVEELTAETTRLVAKYHNEQEPGGRRFRFLIGAYPAVKEKTEKTSETTKEP